MENTVMNISELIQELDISLGSVSVFIIVLLSIVQISPIKINPWSKLLKAVGNSLNHGVMDKIEERFEGIESRFTRIESAVDNIQTDVTALDAAVSGMDSNIRMDQAVNFRVRILRFCDELQEGRIHSKDSFDQVMSDITGYCNYCRENPNFKNNQTETTIEYIKKVYGERLEKRDWM